MRPARQDLVDRGSGGHLVPGDCRLVGDVEHVEQMMRDAAPLGDRQLRGADVHAAVQLHRVGVDDLGGTPVRGERRRRGRATGRTCRFRSRRRRRTGAGRRRAAGPRSADVASARRRAASAGRARRLAARRVGRARARAQDSACVRSHASPARVRRMRSGAPSRVGEQVERGRVGDRRPRRRRPVAGSRCPRAPRSARGGCLRRDRSAGGSRHPSCPRPSRRAPRPDGRAEPGSPRARCAPAGRSSRS